MKLNRYIKHYEEANLRKDDDSHLNDKLSANKKNEGRWPDDDYDYDDDSTKNYGDYDDWYDDDPLFGRPHYGKKSSNPKFDDDDDDDYDDYSTDDDDIESDDMDNLLYLLRQMFRNSGVQDVHVTNRRMDITISCVTRRRENLKEVIKIFEVANKLKKDILAQYDSEFEMDQTKDGRPEFLFHFYYDEGLDDDTMPF